MGTAENSDSRGKVKRTIKKKQKTAVKTQKADIGSKRKLAKFGKRQIKGRTGVAVHYVTRSKALKMLQISLKDFRRLCILKGIYPRDPPKKPIGKQSTAYYAAKDIAFLQHEPILFKFRDMKAVAKKIAKKLGRKEESEAKRLFINRPRYSLDHVVRERYPTFASVLADLDDGLTLINLFAYLPVSLSTTDHGPRCAKIAREWQFYIAKSHTLRKAFVSIKGIYYQAEVRGQAITWLVPHKFSQDVNSLQENKEIDFKVMRTFLEFYETLLEFVMFKLYHEDLQSNYPPTLLQDADQAGAFLKALRADPLTTKKSTPNDDVTKEDLSQKSKRQKMATKNGNQGGGGGAPTLEKVLAETAAKYQKTMKDVAKRAKAIDTNQNDEDDDDEEDDDEEDEAGEDFAKEDAEVRALLENERLTREMVSLFKGLNIFLSREVPLDSCEFLIESFGGHALREDLNDNPNDSSITHFVTDRPMTKESMLPSREYIQPQWLFDCVNAKMLLPVDVYSPLVSSLPPHLSPFVDDEAEGYKPERAKEIEELRRARAANGGTEALLKATGQLKKDDDQKDETNVAEQSDDEDTSDDDGEGDEEEDDEEDIVKRMKKDEEEVEEEKQSDEDDNREVKVSKPEPFIASTTFKGPRPGFFFRRGPQGLGYYLNTSSFSSGSGGEKSSKKVEKFDAEQDAKQNLKETRKNETKEAKEMRTIMMSKKAKHLYERMQYGINKKKEAVENLERKRDDLQQQQRVQKKMRAE